MAQAITVRNGLEFEVERGPDCLFVRPRQVNANTPLDAGSQAGAGNLAEEVWALLEQHFTHRLVLELGDIEQFDSALIGQLVQLQKQIHARDGLMRVCELSDAHRDVLEACHLDVHFPQYATREDAVMAHGRVLQCR